MPLTNSMSNTGAVAAGASISQAQLAKPSVGTPELIDQSVTTAKIADGTILNGDIDAAAGITVGKLSAGGTANRVVLTTDGTTMILGLLTGSQLAAAANIALTQIIGSTAGLLHTVGTAISDGYKAVTNDIATGGQIVKNQLNYNPNVDLQSAAAVAATTWTDVTANQAFTVDDANSLVEFTCNGGFRCFNAVGGNIASTRLNIDNGAQFIMLGSADFVVAASNCNPLAGSQPAKISGLTAAGHNVKLQVFMTGAGQMTLLANTQPNSYFLRMQVNEMKR